MFYIMFCNSNAGKRLFGFIGQIFDIILIAVPIILIVMGTIDFIKAVIAQKDDEMKKAQSLFIKRLIVGVAIFFVFPIVNFLIGLIGEKVDSPCMTCFNNPKAKICEVTKENKDIIKIESPNINSKDCENSVNKDLCCKEKNGPDDSDGIWIWDDDFGCKNTTAINNNEIIVK